MSRREAGELLSTAQQLADGVLFERALDVDAAGEVDEMPDRRAQVGCVGMRATSALVSSVGGRAITLAHHAQRLAREALFLLVQGQTADIRAGHLRRLGAGPTAS